MNLNKVQLAGTLGTEVEQKKTKNGHLVSQFSIATDGASSTEWHQIVAWGKLSELSHKYLIKGRKVFIEGSLHTRSYKTSNGEKRVSTEIIANNIQFLDHKKPNQRTQEEHTLSFDELNSMLHDITESIPT